MQAFVEIGYQVEVVAGKKEERKQAIARIQRDVMRGKQFDFLYSESINNPLILAHRAEELSSPLATLRYLRWLVSNNPNFDIEFLAFLRTMGVPTGYYLRDLFWCFPQPYQSLSSVSRWIRPFLYHRELQLYRRAVDHLFLPDVKLSEVMPVQWQADRVSSLPPGCIVRPCASSHRPTDPSQPLRLFYVGGVAPPKYDLTPSLKAISQVPNVIFTLCCRQPEWERYRHYYASLDLSNVEVLHVHGDLLQPYFEEADVFLYVTEADPYLSYAMPVKVFETLEHALPIIISSTTLASRLVSTENIGWSVSSVEELVNLLRLLQESRSQIAEKRAIAQQVRLRHTWQARAKTVVTTLQSGQPA